MIKAIKVILAMMLSLAICLSIYLAIAYVLHLLGAPKGVQALMPIPIMYLLAGIFIISKQSNRKRVQS